MAYTKINDFPDNQFSFNLSDFNYVCGTPNPRGARDVIWFIWPDMSISTQTYSTNIKTGFKIPDGRNLFDVLAKDEDFVVFKSMQFIDQNLDMTVAINVNPNRFRGMNGKEYPGQPGVLNVKFSYTGGNDNKCMAILTTKQYTELEKKIAEKQQEILARQSSREGPGGSWAGSVGEKKGQSGGVGK